MGNKRFVRINDLESYTGLKTRTIRAYVLNKKIPFIKVNGCLLFDLQEIDSWLEMRKVPVLEQSGLQRGNREKL
ncbi:MAG: helix-turn-helix domain-containing protein [Spirochaetia bacterium]|nr:helix-turn-helix domain-containing protein [Spirochaetia bacterium]MCF7946871.1 helix-turn-helix domain-containing protein [Spirochaetia bacterium]MCF7953905.1 helix-turn-helix domain-containing protein [Spirochaetales bacterium]